MRRQLKLQLLAQAAHDIIPARTNRRLLSILNPVLRSVSSTLTSLDSLRGHPSKAVHVAAMRRTTGAVLLPTVHAFLGSRPRVSVRLAVSCNLASIISRHFSTNIHLNKRVSGSVVTVQVKPSVPVTVINSPSCFSHQDIPASISRLVSRRTVGLCLPASNATGH